VLRYEVIKSLLKAKGRTRQWFRDECGGVPSSSMDLYLSGHRQPNPDLIQKMADALKVPLSVISGEADKELAAESVEAQAG
jgi:transcriptional regulator with XRE-family HTH domain